MWLILSGFLCFLAFLVENSENLPILMGKKSEKKEIFEKKLDNFIEALYNLHNVVLFIQL